MTAFQEGCRHVVEFIHGFFAVCRFIAQRQES